jgi:hypothetical protein
MIYLIPHEAELTWSCKKNDISSSGTKKARRMLTREFHPIFRILHQNLVDFFLLCTNIVSYHQAGHLYSHLSPILAQGSHTGLPFVQPVLRKAHVQQTGSDEHGNSTSRREKLAAVDARGASTVPSVPETAASTLSLRWSRITKGAS